MRARVAICTLVGVFAVLLMIAMTPKQQYGAKGIVLPSQTVRPAISPDHVVIYNETPDVKFVRLGQVRTEIEIRTLDSVAKESLMEKVKSLAASVGANGVVINLLVSNDGMRRMLTFVGTAIYVPSTNARG